MHPLLPMFGSYAAPRCSFNDSERLLLCEALDGHTDEELALELGVSLSAVKKRWVGILDRVERGRPDVFAAFNRDTPTRGAQKRHRLLRYVRAHPEELRPYGVRHGTKRG